MRALTLKNDLFRNFVLFVIMLLFCLGLFSYTLIVGDRELDKTGDFVQHSYGVITSSQELTANIEGMLGAQRGFLLTGKKSFLKEYEHKKQAVSSGIASLSESVKKYPAQQSRLSELRNYFNTFSQKLEERANNFEEPKGKFILGDVGVINSLKRNIVRLNSDFLREEYRTLNTKIQAVESKKSQYFNSLLVGSVLGTLLILIFNVFLINAHYRRSEAETSLQETEDRLALAVEGTQDGIFDWDIKKERVVYSRRFFSMLGYTNETASGTIDDFRDLIHPEDVKLAWDHIEKFLSGEIPEYTQEFRMRHESGKWIWIQSRGKALFDRAGNPYRMVGAHTDITHLVLARERLEAEVQIAREASKAKSEFLAHMSHEIRTPLTSISGVAEIFKKKKEEFSERHQQLINSLVNSTYTLKDLISDVLDFSRIESGELELIEESFRLDDLFEQIISVMSLRASEKGIDFIFDCNELIGANFYGDKKRLRQILVNLIGNAIKFTEEGSVNVAATTEERNGIYLLRIDVSDTGIGIAAEDFDLIFERFKQTDSSVSRKYGGSGLGLPISRNLAKLMGGEIFLTSMVGKGSTFSVLIPMKVSEQKVLKSGNERSVEKLNEEIQNSVGQKDRVLIVEDYEGTIVLLSYMLDEIGLEYDVARTGKDGIDLWNEQRHNLILMDIQMPEMDGLSATKEIRKIEKENELKKTPIIGMTAHAQIQDRENCIKAGMDAYITKPIEEYELKRNMLEFFK